MAAAHDPADQGVCVIIPAYGAADKLHLCLESLALHAASNCEVHVIDDATPDESVRAVCEEVGEQWTPLHYHRSDENRGFVGTCNWGCAHLRSPGSDLLILNSDTEITEGALTEMQAVLYLHEKHAVVTPRSNSATIFSVPWMRNTLPASESHQVWSRVRHLLPRYQLMPTAVGFCMLLKGDIVDQFGLFDEIYSPGYNEENDFVCRVSRLGYCAVAANWAYVYHHESSSFGERRRELEETHRNILLARYPEYERRVTEYIRLQLDPVEIFATLYRPHWPRILFDVRELPPLYSDISEFALELLRSCTCRLTKFCDLYVGIRANTFSFFGRELVGHRIYEESNTGHFDLVFNPVGISDWHEFTSMNELAPRLAYVLREPVRDSNNEGALKRRQFHRSIAELSDVVFTTSDLDRAFSTGSPTKTIQCATTWHVSGPEFHHGNYVLVITGGNDEQTISELLRQLSDWPVKVLGREDFRVPVSSNVSCLARGSLSPHARRQLFTNARLIVCLGSCDTTCLPVLDGLALCKPVIVYDTAISRELAGLSADPNLHTIGSVAELYGTIANLFEATPRIHVSARRQWNEVAQDFTDALKELVMRDIDISKLRRRWDMLRSAD